MSSNSRTTYDLVVIGSGPGGHRAAVQAAKLGKHVLIVERDRIGGSCLHLGTIPSKALREAALASHDKGSMIEIMARAQNVIDEEKEVINEHFTRHSIDFVQGTASFTDANTVQIESIHAFGGAAQKHVKTDFTVIATGTRPRRPADIPFDDEAIFESDSILGLKTPPRTLLVIGAGVIGCEYASIFARMGVRVTLIDSRPELLASIDREIVQALLKQFNRSGVTLRLSTEFRNLKSVQGADKRAEASVELVTGGRSTECRYDAVLYCLGRTGNFESLNLPAVGLQADNRGLLAVDSNYQTKTKSIYAVGDIIGAPALAASSAEQGRLAALHAFTGEKAQFPDTFPYGIYTIPEISSVGVQETELTKRGIAYAVGKAPYPVLARGKMLQDEFGFLKLIVHANTRRIVGVHVIGTSATELVHIGQVAMAFGATVDFFVDNVFNYPTLAEAYKVAAMNAESKLAKR
jgi:NAD(P) transhydrogenase